MSQIYKTLLYKEEIRENIVDMRTRRCVNSLGDDVAVRIVKMEARIRQGVMAGVELTHSSLEKKQDVLGSLKLMIVIKFRKCQWQATIFFASEAH